MTELGFGRLRDLGGLPDLLRHLAGEEGLHRAFRDQNVPLELLDVPDALVPMRDIVALYQRASEIACLRSFGLQATREFEIVDHGLTGQYIMQAC